jgi:hypothetical protein
MVLSGICPGPRVPPTTEMTKTPSSITPLNALAQTRFTDEQDTLLGWTAAAWSSALENAMRTAAQGPYQGTNQLNTVDLRIAVMGEHCATTGITARLIGGGKTVRYCEAKACDADGQVLAQALATFRLAHGG